jgi:hypothetical protein
VQQHPLHSRVMEMTSTGKPHAREKDVHTPTQHQL